MAHRCLPASSAINAGLRPPCSRHRTRRGAEKPTSQSQPETSHLVQSRNRENSLKSGPVQHSSWCTLVDRTEMEHRAAVCSDGLWSSLSHSSDPTGPSPSKRLLTALVSCRVIDPPSQFWKTGDTPAYSRGVSAFRDTRPMQREGTLESEKIEFHFERPYVACSPVIPAR